MIRTKQVTTYELVCDGCRATTPVKSSLEVPPGWVKKSHPPVVELDEFYGRIEHYCPLCQYFKSKVVGY